MWNFSWRTLQPVWRAAVLFVVCTVVVPVTIAAVVLATFIFVPLPASLPEVKGIEASQASRVLDSQGNEIATFRAFDQSLPVSPQDIPNVLKQAIVAAEDSRFYQHNGVDLKGSARAFVRDLQGGGGLQGGSTITQQYVKNTYTGGQRTIFRKIKEAVIASQIDRRTPKDEILFRYMNAIPLGEGSYGVGAAAQNYFRKPVSQLTLNEAATLAGLIPAPSRYSPRDHPAAADNKRRIVLEKMLGQGYIDQAAYDAAVKAVITKSPTPLDPRLATTIYPPLEVSTKYPYFVDYVRRYLLNKYGQDVVFKGGLTVQTTLDPDLQAKAEAVVANALKGTTPGPLGPGGKPNLLNMSLVSVEPSTGRVKALVGGRDPNDPNVGQVNLALGNCPTQPTDAKIKVEVPASCWSDRVPIEGGGAGRQPGSSFKAFTLAAAFAKGIPPNKTYSGAPGFLPPACRGKANASSCKPIANAADGEGFGSYTLTQATAASINGVFARLAFDIGNKSIAEMAKKLGVTQVWDSPQIQGTSFTLGTAEVSGLDMAAAYGVFANRGVRVPATPIVKIVDRDAKVLEDNLQPKGEEILSQDVADEMNQILQGPLVSGTARGKGLAGRQAAGKTGTTNDYKAAWFVGYTPELSTSVSLGYDTPSPMRGVKGVARVFGGTIPAATWQDFMTQALKDVPPTDFTQPPPVQKVEDAIQRLARGGIDPGDPQVAVTTPIGGPYLVQPATPKAPVPSGDSGSTTTTRPVPPSTTSTTLRGLFP